MGPKESKESKAARKRERLAAEKEQRLSAQGSASSLTTDFRSVFAKPSIFKLATLL